MHMVKSNLKAITLISQHSHLTFAKVLIKCFTFSGHFILQHRKKRMRVETNEYVGRFFSASPVYTVNIKCDEREYARSFRMLNI